MKKKFLKPEAEIVDFKNNDIITLSGADVDDGGMEGGDNTEPLFRV